MRVQIKFVIFLFFLNVSIFSTEYLSSNGNIFFTYSEKNHRIEKINMNIENIIKQPWIYRTIITQMNKKTTKLFKWISR